MRFEVALSISVGNGTRKDQIATNSHLTTTTRCLLDGTPERVLYKGEYKPLRDAQGHFNGSILDIRV